MRRKFVEWDFYWYLSIQLKKPHFYLLSYQCNWMGFLSWTGGKDPLLAPIRNRNIAPAHRNVLIQAVLKGIWNFLNSFSTRFKRVFSPFQRRFEHVFSGFSTRLNRVSTHLTHFNRVLNLFDCVS